MKRWLIVVIVAILLSLTVVFSEIYVSNTLNNILLNISVLQNKIENLEDINSQETILLSTTLDEYWKKREKVICLAYNHKDMEKIGEQATKIKMLVLQNDKKACEYELQILKYYVEGYKDVITCNFQNIL